MRLVFAGTPAAAVPTLRALAAQHEILAVITRPDAPQGRKRILTPSPVAAAAGELGLPVIQAAALGETVTDEIARLAPELGVVVAYGGLVRERLLAVPRQGWINLHFSLLPRWRGAAPVQWSLIAGDEQIGSSVFQLVRELDAGDVYDSRTVVVPAEATAGTVLEILAEDGADLTAGVVSDIADGHAVATPQTGTVTLAPKLSWEDGRLDWELPAAEIYARFRGVTPEPGAWTVVDDLTVKILEMTPEPDVAEIPAGAVRAVKDSLLVGSATCALRLSRVQPAGRSAMAAGDWWRGRRTPEGRLG